MSIEKAKKYLKEKEEKAKLSQKRSKEVAEYNRIQIAAISGKRDAANEMFKTLADEIRTGTATQDQLLLTAEVLEEIADNDQALNFLPVKSPKTKPTRNFFQMQKVYDAVKYLHEKEEVPLISNDEKCGAFGQVAESFQVSESTVNRNYYEYKQFLKIESNIYLRNMGAPENIEKLKLSCRQEFEGLMSALTEEMTDEQKREVRASIWPKWVDNFINHYFDA